MKFEKDWGRLGLSLSDWKEYKIADLVKIIFSGGTPNTKVNEYWNGSLPWLSSGETKNRYINSTEKTITESGAQNSSTRLALSGDVVMASAGQGYTRGQVSFLNIDTFINQSVIAIRANEKVLDKKFLFYNLSSRYEELRAISDSNSIRGSITTKMVKSMNIRIPDLNTQKAIANTLSSIDDKIETSKQINHHLVAISKNYLKIFYSSNSIKLGDIFELKSGYAFKSKDWVDEGKPVIKIKDIDGITIDITNLNYVKNKSQLSKASNFEVFGKEIVMALTGATTGKIGVIPKNFNGYVNQRVGLFYAKTELSYAVLWSILQQQNIITDLIKLSSGSAQANLSPFSVNSYDLNVTFKDLIELDKVLSPLYELFCFNLSEIQRLSKLRDTLLPKLLSGELSVNQAIK